jgi:hypothetical protein
MPLKYFNDGRSGFRFNWPERRLRMRSLYTDDPAEAERRAKLLRDGMTARDFKSQFAGTKKKGAPVSEHADRMAKYRTEHPEQFQSPGQPAAPPAVDPTLEEVLNRVAAARVGDAPTVAPSEPDVEDDDTPEEPDVADANEEWDTDAEAPEAKQKRRKFGKLARDLGALCASTNILLDGAIARGFRSNKTHVWKPQMPPDEIQAVMQEGYDMQVKEWAEDHPPRPWMLILGANIACIAVMLANGVREERGAAQRPTVVPPTPNAGTTEGAA